MDLNNKLETLNYINSYNSWESNNNLEDNMNTTKGKMVTYVARERRR